MKAAQLGFLEDPARFKAMRDSLASMNQDEKADILKRLDDDMKSSAWATKELFKPGIRNLFLQEQLGAHGMVKQFEHFLGDQEYLFKFFFQNAFTGGKVPQIMDLLRQGINIPAFRFRLESIDMLVELDGAEALPALYNLVSGLDKHVAGSRAVMARIEASLEPLGEASAVRPKLADVFTRLRLLLVRQAP